MMYLGWKKHVQVETASHTPNLWDLFLTDLWTPLNLFLIDMWKFCMRSTYEAHMPSIYKVSRASKGGEVIIGTN